MFSNFSLPELLIVGALALIVIGPKDLPKMMRSVGKFVGQARGMARQFQDAMNDAAREVDLEELRDARALMNKRADTKSVTDPFNKLLDIDDDGAPASKPAPEPVRSLNAEERDALARESGFGDTPKATEAASPEKSTEPEKDEARVG